MADKIAKRGVSIFIDGKEVKNSVAGISAEMRKLQAEQKKMTIGSDEYMAHAKKIAYLDSVFQEHKANQKSVAQEYKKMGVEADSYAKKAESSISKMANGINKYFAMFTAGLAAVTGLTLGLKKFMDERNKVEDSKADLKALTGLDDASVNKLTGFAKKMSENPIEGTKIRIKSSVAEILEAYKLVGSAKPELLKDAEALNEVTKQSMILSQAAGMPLADAVHGTVIALNQYSAGADQAAKYVNILAAGSQAGAQEVPYITEALVKFGAVAKLANVPFEQSVALIEAIGEKGFQAEVAGTGIKTFFTKLLQGADETNPAIVGMHTALENLNKKFSGKGGFSEMTKLFGQDNVVVAQTLIANRARFDELTTAVTGTNTAIDQATITSATNSAKMAQAQNKFMNLGMELVKNLNPAMLKATNIGNAFLKLLVQIPDYWKENKTGVIAFTAALIAYGVALNAQLIATKSKLVLGALEKVLDYVKIVALRTRIALTGEATIAELQLLDAQNALNSAMMKNIWGLVAAAIAIATVYLISYLNKANELTEAQKIANGVMEDYRNNFAENSKDVMEEKAQLTGLVTAIINTNDNQATRNRLIDELNKKYPGFISFIDKEKVTNELLAQALADVNEQYDMKLRSVALNSKSQAYEQATVKAMQRQIEIQEELNLLRSQPQNNNEAKIKALVDEDRQLSTNIKTYENASSTFRANAAKNDEEIKKMNTSGYYAGLMTQYKAFLKTASENRENSEKGSEKWSFYDKQIADANAAFKYASLKYNEIKKLEQKNKKPTKPTGDSPNNFGAAPDKPKDPYKEDLKALEDFWKDDEAINKNAYAKEVIGEDVFHQFMYDNKLGFLEDKLKLQKKYGQDTTETEIAISEAIISENEYWNNKIKMEAEKLKKDTDNNNKKTEKDLKDHLKRIEAIRNEFGLENIRLSYADELKLLKEKLKEEKATEEETAKAIADFKRKTAEGYANNAALIAQRLSGALNNLVESEQMAVDNKYAAQIKAAKTAGKDTTALEEKAENEKKEIKKKYADLQFAITVAGIIAETAAAVMKASPNVLLQAAEGILGASQLAIAVQQRNAVANLWTGGYTPNVGKYTPTGVIHGGEFVSSMEAVNNPHLRPMLDAIDEAQKNGTVSSLSKSDLAKALNINSTADTPTRTRTAVAGGNPNAPDNPIYAAMLARQAEVIDKLNRRLDEPFEAYSVISGKNGSFEQTKKYEKLIKNASR